MVSDLSSPKFSTRPSALAELSRNFLCLCRLIVVIISTRKLTNCPAVVYTAVCRRAAAESVGLTLAAPPPPAFVFLVGLPNCNLNIAFLLARRGVVQSMQSSSNCLIEPVAAESAAGAETCEPNVECASGNPNASCSLSANARNSRRVSAVDLASGTGRQPQPHRRSSNSARTSLKGTKCNYIIFALAFLLVPLGILASHSYHSCVIVTGGAVKCWGFGDSGGLGTGDYSHRSTPTSVIGLNSEALSISVGYGHSCAVVFGGAVKCWGGNTYGQLGIGSTCCQLCQSSSACQMTPVDVIGLSSGAVSVHLGGSHSCAIVSGGCLKCWGRNAEGQLGVGSTTNLLIPADVFGLSSGVIFVSGGNWHTCAILTTGALKCWGRNLEGQLGLGSTSAAELTPKDPVGMGTGVLSVSLGVYHSCAIVAGAVKCWGANTNGQLGTGDTLSQTTPASVIGLSSGVISLSVGEAHGCAILTEGAVKCWGMNSVGQLGTGSASAFEVMPSQVVGLSSGALSLALGQYTSFVYLTGDTVKCFGYDRFGQLGIGYASTDNGVNAPYYDKCMKTPTKVNGLSLLKFWDSAPKASVAIDSFAIATSDRLAFKTGVSITLAFTPVTSLPSGGTITLTYPSGFFASSVTPIVAAGASSVAGLTANCSATTATSFVITTSGASISTSAFTITIKGLTMGAATKGAVGITVSSSADPVQSPPVASGAVAADGRLELALVLPTIQQSTPLYTRSRIRV